MDHVQAGAVAAADLALMTAAVALLPAAIDLGRTCTRLVKQNIGIAVGVKALVVVCALAFDLALWVAVLADLGSLLLVVANGSRPLLEAAPAPPPSDPQPRHSAGNHCRVTSQLP